ncbi:hypothetical protein T10_49 [Trichinella papuae]|uniref:Uncharacterized protein n=1 Tax=Trichinella papuae TaxID=268474 RepID=A0A0V1M775_9BILA|nr:hypothetical protein T10_49 [Trichinella papuae]
MENCYFILFHRVEVVDNFITLLTNMIYINLSIYLMTLIKEAVLGSAEVDQLNLHTLVYLNNTLRSYLLSR